MAGLVTDPQGPVLGGQVVRLVGKVARWPDLVDRWPGQVYRWPELVDWWPDGQTYLGRTRDRPPSPSPWWTGGQTWLHTWIVAGETIVDLHIGLYIVTLYI